MPEQHPSPWFATEWAQRALTPSPLPGRPRRPMIARFLNFKDCDPILKEAGLCPDLRWNNHNLVFPNYTCEVQYRCRSYKSVKQKLRAMQLTYMLLFPARIKVFMDGKYFFFDSSEAAWDWLTEEGRLARRGPPCSGGALQVLDQWLPQTHVEDADAPGPAAGRGVVQAARLPTNLGTGAAIQPEKPPWMPQWSGDPHRWWRRTSSARLPCLLEGRDN
ncbi:hypothetical protein NDU88_005762 [Pleurodeles waltl]|uniref:Uncharacterized protein n=1 Tax=Pleurodeles waltl TaxID=8319 RepID=A0AAV7WVN3_PLEWA|nr:hypothetical protein NDU88_005762 [Pleurodeles waltl]